MKIITRRLLWIIYIGAFLLNGLVFSQTPQLSLTVDVSKPGAEVAPICRGQQIEEFNHQIQGGFYAQLINNPSFEEIDENRHSNPAANWFVTKQGSSDGNIHGQSVSQTVMLNKHQNHCIKLTVTSVASGSVGLANGGYWGIGLKNKTTYKVSFWARKGINFSGTLIAKLESNGGLVYAQSAVFKVTDQWQHFTCDLVTQGISKVTGNNRFVIYASSTGDVYFDVVTIMPPTWKNRPNGLRPDLGEMMNGLKIKYLEYPGGNDAQYASLDKARAWKNSIGPIEERSGSTCNVWKYKNDLYFGLDEFFQLARDMGTQPVYVVTAGILKNREEHKYEYCPLEKMQPIIDDILDLIEYCNGGPSTKWGAIRVANGNSEPYNLKYIQIGNENGHLKDEYFTRYSLIQDAIKSRYPYVQCLFNGHSGEVNTKIPEISHAHGNQLDYTCETYNCRNNGVLYNRFDSIDPTCKKISVVEYSSSAKGNDGNITGNFQDALADAIFMLGCEKNSQRIWWTGYGNYGSFTGHTQYGPCLVWNDATSCFASPAYYMEKMLFSENQGTYVLPFSHNTQNCFWSATIDKEAGKKDVLLKVVNKLAAPELVDITLSGIDKVDKLGHFTTMTASPDDENSLANPTKIVPKAGTFLAGASFKYNVPAWSITVLRISILIVK